MSPRSESSPPRMTLLQHRPGAARRFARGLDPVWKARQCLEPRVAVPAVPTHTARVVRGRGREAILGGHCNG